MRALHAVFAAFIMVVAGSGLSSAFAAEGRSASTPLSPSEPKLVAIDIVVLPGALVRRQAEQANGILVATFPNGFAFGDDYVPHISLLQMFTEKGQIAQIKDNGVSAKDLALTSTGIQQGLSVSGSLPAIYAPKLAFIASKGLADLQAALVAALSPYRRMGGTANAFLVNDTDRAAAAKLGLPAILPLGMQLVDAYVAKESGRKFAPHITLGLANDEAWQKLSELLFESETADSEAVALCLLGPYDSCHRIKRS